MIAVFVVHVSLAQASGRSYCGELVAPQTACPDAVTAYVTEEGENEAYYSGSGYVGVCERIDTQYNGTISRVCSSASDHENVVFSGQLSGALYENWTFIVGNNDIGHYHTINGYAAWDY